MPLADDNCWFSEPSPRRKLLTVSFEFSDERTNQHNSRHEHRHRKSAIPVSVSQVGTAPRHHAEQAQADNCQKEGDRKRQQGEHKCDEQGTKQHSQ